MLLKGITLNPPIFPSPINSIHLWSNMIWVSVRFIQLFRLTSTQFIILKIPRQICHQTRLLPIQKISVLILSLFFPLFL